MVKKHFKTILFYAVLFSVLALQGLISSAAATVTSITISPATVNFTGPNQVNTTLKTIANYSDGTSVDITNQNIYKTTSSSIATVAVNTSGQRYFKSGTAAGTATITATYGGMTATCTAVQALELKAIKLSYSTLTISGNNKTSVTLKATATHTNSTTTKDVSTLTTFTTSNSDIVSITDRIVKSGSKSGTATITADYLGKTATCTVTVKAVLSSIYITPSTVTIATPNTVGEPIKVIAKYSDGTTADVTANSTFSTNYATIATVENGCFKSGTTAGTATITAKYSTKSATRTVVHARQVKDIALNYTTVSISGPNKTSVTFKVTATYTNSTTTGDVSSYATYTSSDNDIAYVSSKVLKSGSKSGTATITITYAGKTLTCEVAAKPGILGITVNPANNIIAGLNATGQKVSVIANYSDGTTKVVTTSSKYVNSDTTVFTFSSYYCKSGSAYGTATLTATYGGKTAVSTISVVQPYKSISLAPTSALIKGANTSGGNVQVIATFQDNTTQDVTNITNFISSDSNIAYVKNGVIMSGNKGGNAVITVAFGTQTAAINVETQLILKSIAIVPDKLTVVGSNTAGPKLKVNATYDNGSVVDVTNQSEFTSSNANIVRVANQKVNSGTQRGNATITAKFKDMSAICTATVTATPSNGSVVRKNLEGTHGSITKITVSASSFVVNGLNKEGSPIKVMAGFTDGYSLDITNKTMYNSSNGNIATVIKSKASDKVIKSGTKEGKVKITAIYGGVKQAFEVTVIK